MKMNSDLGYKPVTFSELTDDQSFWNGCQTCKNYDVFAAYKSEPCACVQACSIRSRIRLRKTSNAHKHELR